MSDVRDVLGLSGASAAAPSGRASAASRGGSAAAGGAAAAAASNVPRELQQLRSEFSWGASAPIAMAPTPPLGAFKAKRVKAVSWKCLPIRSSARAAITGKVVDDIDLRHWVKIHNVPDYRFARFNKSIKLLEYSNAEYDAYCADPTWSREETDRLMELAKKFDLRFVIMQDRYNAMSEDAKARAKREALPTVDEARLAAAQQRLAEPTPTPAQPAAEASQAQPMTTAEQPQTEEKQQQQASTVVPTPTESTGASTSTSEAAIAPIPAAATATADGAVASSNESITVKSETAPMVVDGTSDASPAPVAPTATTETAAAPSPVTAAPTPASVPTDSTAQATAEKGAPAPNPSPVSTVAAPSATSSSSSAAVSLASSSGGIFPERSVEQLKSRFYFLQQTLSQLRNASDPDLRKTNPLFTHPYDASHELLRKAQLERLYQRQTDEIDEMAQIVLEHRNIAAQIKKIKKGEKESRDALRGYKTNTKSSRSGRADAAGGAAASAAATGSSRDKKKSVKRPVGVPLLTGELAPLPPSCDASMVLPPRANGTVYLRSAQLAHPLNVSAKQSKHLEGELSQLNLRRIKDLSVPTGVVCEMWDKLRVNILTLVNLQQYVRDKETMRDDLQLHAANHHHQQPAAAAAAAPTATLQRQVSDTAGATSPAVAPFGAGAAAAQSSAQQAQALAARKKQQEKRRLDGTDPSGEQPDEKRAKKK